MRSFHRLSYGSPRATLGCALAIVASLLIPEVRCPAQSAPRPAPGTRPAVHASDAIVQQVTESNQRLDMTVNTSRILTLGRRIPQVNINNPAILGYAALSPTQIQIFAQAPGATQVNLWDEAGQIYTIDVMVYGDVRELSELLQTEFPTASLNVRAIANGVLISGYVENADHVPRIIAVAEEYYPQVVDNIQVGGVNQVLLHVKVIEVSRTKLQAFGFDWWQTSSNGGMITSDAANILGDFNYTTNPPILGGNATLGFTVFDGLGAFYGVIEALCEDNVAKVRAEPTLVTYNGRPARFLSGGQVPIQSGGGLGVPSNVEYRDYGVVLDFVPVVLGNGRIRLEVRPSVSEIDSGRSYNGNPAFKVREADTGLELRAGQTLAIAGILETLTEAERRGIPFVSDVPYIGALFRHVETRQNEVELLILVTPELVAAMDADQLPPCGPGMDTTLPSTWDLMIRGHIEVPDCCGVCGGTGCAECEGRGYCDEVLPGDEPGMIGSPDALSPVNSPGVLQMTDLPAGPRRERAASVIDSRLPIDLPETQGPSPSDRTSSASRLPARPVSRAMGPEFGMELPRPTGDSPSRADGPAAPLPGRTPPDPSLPATPTRETQAPRFQMRVRDLPRPEAPSQLQRNSSPRRDMPTPPGEGWIAPGTPGASREDAGAVRPQTAPPGPDPGLRGRLTSSLNMDAARPAAAPARTVTPDSERPLGRAPYAPPGGVPSPTAGPSAPARPPMPPMVGPVGYDPTRSY